MKRTLISIGILAVLVGFTFYTNFNKTELPTEVRPLAGYLAPDFTIVDLNGNSITLSELQGKPVFINFWASWCEPCRIEMPHLQKAYEKYGDQIHFLMINQVDGDDYQKMLQYVEESGFTFSIYLDEGFTATKLYQAISIPTSLFITKDGVIMEKVLGTMDEATIEGLMKSLVKK